MNSIEKRLETLEYYQSLLLKIVEPAKFPFYHLVMSKGLSKEEIEEVLMICEELSRLHEEQKAQGLVIFTDLLTRFAGQLNPKLDLYETIHALHRQNLYSSLMDDFVDLM
ncbi:DUF1878 family protein [Metabacillus halosaccharovorans]|uniref:YhaI family protein n=1 Tax=Metabacillus halosaccharovorans TaxID=930124 RepID=A0ABT3DJE6_9BACI|nr:DUF1878 family protein [Metabacillus halosaccharovorans]MCM3442504.1 YhaI family protein [Metabacillus halosaccharovorans]MCV9887173.1 YhaI family protein [Metabacillus halosaccharovorans]